MTKTRCVRSSTASAAGMPSRGIVRRMGLLVLRASRTHQPPATSATTASPINTRPRRIACPYPRHGPASTDDRPALTVRCARPPGKGARPDGLLATPARLAYPRRERGVDMAIVRDWLQRLKLQHL